MPNEDEPTASNYFLEFRDIDGKRVGYCRALGCVCDLGDYPVDGCAVCRLPANAWIVEIGQALKEFRLRGMVIKGNMGEAIRVVQVK